MLASRIGKILKSLFDFSVVSAITHVDRHGVAARRPHLLLVPIVGSILIAASAAVYADGNETLGPPSISIADGTGFVFAGTGMVDQPGTIDLVIPNGAALKQVLLYWQGFSCGEDSLNSIIIEGFGSVAGTKIGGPDLYDDTPGVNTNCETETFSTIYRADITGLNLVFPGANAISLSNPAGFNVVNNGAGIVAIIDDGSGAAELGIRDGDDIAYIGFVTGADTALRQNTVPQTFTFEASPEDRTANLNLFFGSVAGLVSGGGIRPTSIAVDVPGAPTVYFDDLLLSGDGDEWDTLDLPVTIPANATSLTVQAFSEDRLGLYPESTPASFVWLVAGLSVPPRPLAALGDRVWLDVNGNGAQDCTEGSSPPDDILGNAGDSGPECDQGIPDVIVRLVDPVDGVCGRGDSWTLGATTTDANGFYRFDNLEAGNYCVAWKVPPGFECTVPNNTGFNNIIDSDGAPLGSQWCYVTETISLDEGEIDLTWDQGLVQPPEVAALGDRVWLDLDRDGVQDCTENSSPPDDILGNTGDFGPECDQGIPDVIVRLVDPVDGVCGRGDSWNLGVTTTDANGFYRFDNLEPGNYCVAWKVPPGLECTLPNAGTNNAVDSDGAPLGDQWCYISETISLDAGETDLTWDQGLVLPELAAIGDRVWHDLNGDGKQNCNDSNGDGIIGNAGGNLDTNAECGTGIPNIQVELLLPGADGDCNSGDETVFLTTVTDQDGLYLFEELQPGVEYCVQFDVPPDSFCDVENFQLGTPLFTTQNKAGVPEKKDSDADPLTGQTDGYTTVAGVTNRNIDAGIICPVKIGDRVWEDDGDGIQEPGEPNIAGVDVELVGCGPDMIAGTSDDVTIGEVRTTDSEGMYMFGGETNYSLYPGKYYVLFSESTYPAGYSPTLLGDGSNDALDSDCKPGGMTQCTDLTASGTINLDRDCGLLPPPPKCDLLIDKTCKVDPPPPVSFDKCSGRLQQFTLIWNGAGTITASGPNNVEVVSPGEEATFFGPFSDNDVIVNISGAQNGQSVFHTSCSDDNFNDPSDCGKMAGDGKSDDSSKINDWILEGFVDADGLVLDCSPDDGGSFAQNCTYVQPVAPSCETTGKPVNLTWRYDGGSCADSTFDVQSDFTCSGSVNAGVAITVMDDDGGSYLVNPGDEFDMPLDGAKAVSLSNSGGTQSFTLHTSCSQTIEAGLTAGALTLVALDGQRNDVGVTYEYKVTNLGDTLTGLTVFDDKLGSVGGPITLGTGADAMFSMSTRIEGTTVNTATASGNLPDGNACSAADTVVVEEVLPGCNVSIAFEKLESKKIKWKLSNFGSNDAVIDDITISWPGSTTLKKIKYDGNTILDNASLQSGSTIDQWLKEVKDRTVYSGDSGKTLEFEFNSDFPSGASQGDFDLEVNFEQGCSVTY